MNKKKYGIYHTSRVFTHTRMIETFSNMNAHMVHTMIIRVIVEIHYMDIRTRKQGRKFVTHKALFSGKGT